MKDYEFLARVHQLGNHLEACDELLTSQRMHDGVDASTKAYAQRCADWFVECRSEAGVFSGSVLHPSIENELKRLSPLAVVAAWSL
jgi:hypothetical protein